MIHNSLTNNLKHPTLFKRVLDFATLLMIFFKIKFGNKLSYSLKLQFYS